MKILLSLFAMVSCVIATTAQNQKFQEYIKYTVPIIENDIELVEQDWRFECLEPSVHFKLVNALMKKAVKGEIKSYSADEVNVAAFPNIYQKELTKEEAEKCFYEEYYYEYFDDYDEIIEGKDRIDILPMDIVSVSFYEEWTFNQEAGSLLKKVHGLTLNKVVRNENGEIRGMKELIYIPLNQGGKMKAEHKLTDQLAYAMCINNPNAELQKEEWWNNNLEGSVRFKLLSGLLADVDAGKREVFTRDYPYYKELDADLIKANSVALGPWIEEIDDYGEPMWDEMTGDLLMIRDTSEITFASFDSLTFIEDWYFDAENLTFDKHVHGFIPQNAEATMYLIPLNGDVNTYSKFKDVQVDKILSEVNFGTYGEEGTKERLTQDRNYNKQHVAEADTNALWKNLGSLFSKVKSGDITTFAANGPSGVDADLNTEYPYKDIPKELFNLVELVPEYDEHGEPMYDLETGEEVLIEIITPIEAIDVRGLYFNEQWNYDAAKNQFTKTIAGYSPQIERFDESGNFRGYQPMFYMEPTGATPSLTDAKHLIGKNIQYNVPIRTASEGGSWKSGQDIFQSMDYGNWWYENMEPSKRKTLLQELLIRAGKGEIEVFENFGAAKKMKKADVLKKMKEVVYELVTDDDATDSPHYDPETGGPAVLVETASSNNYHYTDMHYIRFHENWYMNPETFQMHKQVVGITLMVEKATVVNPGTKKEDVMPRTAPLFYIPMN
jgi:hypothetical protein